MTFEEDPVTGCRGCASGPGGESNIFGNKYGQHLAAIQIAREELQDSNGNEPDGPEEHDGPDGLDGPEGLDAPDEGDPNVNSDAEGDSEEGQEGEERHPKRARH